MDHETPTDLGAAGEELLTTARSASSGRAARSLLPGSEATLRQTLLALAAGNELAEHTAPGPATLLVLRGEATLVAGDTSTTVGEAGWVEVPTGPHEVRAESDAVLLLSVAPRS